MVAARCAILAFAFGCVGFVRPALAESVVLDNEEDVPPDVARAAPRTTVLLSPGIIEPFATLGLERRLGPWLGIAGLAGGGWTSARPEGQDFHFVPTYEVGGQVRTHLFVPTKAWLASD